MMTWGKSLDNNATVRNSKTRVMRRCAVTGISLEGHQALRFELLGVHPVLKTGSPRKKGRTAYVSLEPEALKSLSAKHFQKAFRSKVSVIVDAAFWETVVEQAHVQLKGCLGLARRQNSVILGVDAVLSALESHKTSEPVFVATDAAPRSASRFDDAHTIFDRETLGRAVGSKPVAALALTHPEFKQRATYWCHVRNLTLPLASLPYNVTEAAQSCALGVKD